MIQSTPLHRIQVVAALALAIIIMGSGCGPEIDPEGYVVIRTTDEPEVLPYQFNILSRHPVKASDGKATIGRMVPVPDCGEGRLHLYWAIDHWRRPESLSSVILFEDYRFTEPISHLHIPTMGFSDNHELDYNHDRICDIALTYRTDDTVWLSVLNEEQGIFLTMPLATGPDLNNSGHWDGRGYILCDRDLDGDGSPELLISIDTGYDLYPRALLCVDLMRAEIRWQYEVAGIVFDQPLWVGPLEEGGPTVVIISVHSKGNAAVANGMDDLHGYMIALDANGNELRRRITDQVFRGAQFVVVDYNQDGRREVALVQRDTLSAPGQTFIEASHFIVLDSSWNPIDRVELAPGRADRIDRLDIDGDGIDEIQIPFPDGRVMFLNEQLEVVGRVRLPQRCYNWTAGDFLGSGEQQLITGTGDGGLWLLLSRDYQPLARINLPEGHMASLARFIPGAGLGEPMMTVAAGGSTVFYTLGLDRSPWWTAFAREPWLGPVIVFIPMVLLAMLIAWLWRRARRQTRTIVRQRDRLSETISQLRVAQQKLVAAEELETAQAALKASEQRFRELADLLPQPVYEMNLQGLITYTNKAGIRIFKIDSEKLEAGIHWTHFIDESEHEVMRARIDDIVQQGIEDHREWLARLPDGTRLPVLIYSNPVHRGGLIDGIRGIVVDISDLKESQRALAASEEKYRALVESASEAIFMMDYQGRYLFINSIAARRLGGQPADYVGKTIHDLFPKEVADRHLRSTREVFDAGQGGIYESRTVLKEEEHIYRTSLQPVRDADGKVFAVMGIGRDITALVVARRELQHERDFVRRLLDTANGLIICLDDNFRITVFNDEAERVTGYSRAEVLGKDWREIAMPEDHPSHQIQNFRAWIDEHPRDTYEGPLRTKDGDLRTILWSNSSLVDEATGEVTAIAVGQDITDRIKAEEALRQSEQEYRLVVESVFAAIAVVDSEGRFLFVNRIAAAAHNVKPEEMIGRTQWEFFPPPMADRQVKNIRRVIDTGEPLTEEAEVREPERGICWYQTTLQPYRDASGRIVAALVVAHDITEAKQATEALRESEERYATLVEAARDAIIVADVETRKHIFANSAASRIFGIPHDEIINTGVHDETSPSGQQKAMEVFEAILNGRSVPIYDVPARRRDGRQIFVDVSGVRATFEGRDVIIGFFRDVTERHEATRALLESEERFRSIAETMPVAIAIASLHDYRLTYANSFCESLFGCTTGEMIGLPTTELYFARDEREALLSRVLETGKVDNYEVRLKRKDGSQFWSLLTIRRTFFEGQPSVFASFIDITERRRTERELRRAAQERYELSKRIAGSVAHEIYNSLFPISTSVAKLGERIDLHEPDEVERNRKLLNLAERALRRAVEATGLVKEYSRLESERSSEPVDLTDVINEVLETNAERIAELDVTVNVSTAPDVGPGMARRHAFSLFNNLLINALDALNEVERKRRIDISASLHDGQWRIEFADNGPGIPEDQREQVFKPFYTTKKTHGTGLGLAMVQQIVGLYGGHLELETGVDRFTKFVIFLSTGGQRGNA